MWGFNAPLPKMYRGVTKIEDGRYEARIFKDGRESRIGVYESDVEAAIAYDLTADASLGEYAVLNFPEIAGSDIDSIVE